VQTPDWQVSPPLQARPQLPQLATSDWRFVQALPHESGVAAFGHSQPPSAQICAAGHTLPHAPQLLLLLDRSKQDAPQ
jgi:hypothetical protein